VPNIFFQQKPIRFAVAFRIQFFNLFRVSGTGGTELHLSQSPKGKSPGVTDVEM
jgi:hypothetical protein